MNNGVQIPGWVIKIVVPAVLAVLGTLGYSTVETQNTQATSQDAIVVSCQQTNELKATLRDILIGFVPPSRSRAGQERLLRQSLEKLTPTDCSTLVSHPDEVE